MISLIILIINTIVYYSCFHFRNIVTARCLYYIVVAILASLINQTSNLNKLYLSRDKDTLCCSVRKTKLKYNQ